MFRPFLTALLLGCATCTAHADSCDSWTHRAYPVTLEACSYSNGSSGYYRITNDGRGTAKLCWSVVTNSGRVSKGCNSSLDAGDSTTGVCVACGSKNEGVKYILLDKYEAK